MDVKILRSLISPDKKRAGFVCFFSAKASIHLGEIKESFIGLTDGGILFLQETLILEHIIASRRPNRWRKF